MSKKIYSIAYKNKLLFITLLIIVVMKVNLFAASTSLNPITLENGKVNIDNYVASVSLKDNSFIAVGQKYNTITSQGEPRATRIYADGTIVELPFIDGAYNGTYRAVISTSDGGAIALGSARMPNDTTHHQFAVKISADNSVSLLERPEVYGNGYYFDGAITTSGDTIAVGYQNGPNYKYKPVIVKIKPDGSAQDLAYPDTPSTAGSEIELSLFSVTATNDGGAVAVGYTTDSTSKKRPFVVKIDETGSVVRLDNGFNNLGEFYDVESTDDGGAIAVGFYNNGINGVPLVVKITASGQVEKFTDFFNTEGYYSSIVKKGNSNYAIVGLSNNGPVALILNEDGSVSQFDTSSIDGSLNKVINQADGSLLVLGSESYKSFIISINTDGEIVKANHYDENDFTLANPPTIKSVSTNSTGQILAVGNVVGPNRKISIMYNTNPNKVSVTYRGYDGALIESKIVDKGTILVPPTVPLKTGYKFTNWYTDNSYAIKYNLNQAIQTDTIIYANYVEDTTKYTVTFNTNEGALIDNQEVFVGENALKPTDNPTKSGYIFDDWYADETYNTKFNFTNPITENTTVYAKFISKDETIKYTVTFDTNGGSTITNQIVAANGKAIKPATNPVKDGYTFVDWYTSKDFKVKFDYNTKIIKDTTIYAKYNAKNINDDDIKKPLPNGGNDISKLIVILMISISSIYTYQNRKNKMIN